MGAHVLVVDDDPQIRRILGELLTKRGFGVDVAEDGEEGYAKALARSPDLLVTDIMMPKLDGWELVRMLRLEPTLANLPVIFLTALSTDDSRLQSFRLGPDDYVNKPFKFNDLVARIEKVLGAKVGVDRKKSSGLAGDLAQVGLSTLLVLIEMERKTGVLQLTADDGRTGSISVRNGKVIDASLEHLDQLDGADAVYVMLTFTAGRFEFSVRLVDIEDRIEQSTTHLLMEGARLMDEADAPDAVEQLDENAIGDWGVAERTPVVAAAKLADTVRRRARKTVPPYSPERPSSPNLRPSSPNLRPSDPKLRPSGPKLRPSGPNLRPSGSNLRPSNSNLRPSGSSLRPSGSNLESAKPSRAARRASPRLLVACAVVATAGAATFMISPKPTASPTLDLHGDAIAIGAALDRGVAAAQARADGIAANPDGKVEAASGEEIEVFQLRNGTLAATLRVPLTAREFAPQPTPRVRVDEGIVEVVASAPSKNQQGETTGTVAVSLAVDLKDVAAPLARHTQGAKLVGLDQPVILVPGGTSAATSVTVPITSKAVTSLALEARVATTAAGPSWVAATRYAAFALAGILLLLYVGFAVRAASSRD
ncbi:MAG TPA: response regulator [Kofleriaceae bacterium]|nr:response regulator [Kofleriaceae bacterium]